MVEMTKNKNQKNKGTFAQKPQLATTLNCSNGENKELIPLIYIYYQVKWGLNLPNF